MVYELVVGHDSPFTHARPVGHTYAGVTIHHWDDPAKGPTFEGTVAWLTRPAANASAHFVVEAGRVAVLADPAIQLTWHAGDGQNGPGNTTQISIEVNPRWSDEDYLTVAELVRELRRIHGDLPLYPHRHWTITACPGIADLERIDRLARAGDTMIFDRHPVNNPSISQLFGVGATRNNPHPVYGDYQPYGHDGIDYACPTGTLVYSPGPGVIEYAGWGQDMPAHVAAKWGFVAGPNGWPSGIITLINHNGSIGSYLAHKSRSDYDNRVGQWIPAGTVIGLSGNTGRSGGPHVHWSAVRFPVNYLDGHYSRVNPLDYFTKVTNIPVAPGATGDPATGTKPKEWYEMPIPNEDLKKIYDAVWFGAPGAKLIPRRYEKGGEWPEATLGSMTDRIIRQQLAPMRSEIASANAQIKGLVGAVSALAKGEPFDEAKLLAGVQAAATAGVKEAIDSIETTVNVKGQ